MGRRYSVSFAAVSCSAAQDLFEITPADDKPVKLKGYSIAQTGVSDVGDAAEELLRIEVVRGHSTSGSGGSTPTPRPMNPGDAAASFTCEANNTTIASSGTAVILHEDAFNVRSGQNPFWWPDGWEPECSQGAGTLICLRLVANPADAITLSGTLYVEEFG